MSNTTWKAFERKGVRWLNKMGIPAKRALDETREGNTGDILGELRSWSPTGNGTGKVVARIVGQAKFRKAPSPWKSQTEADAVCSPSDIAFGIVRRKNDQTLITLRPRIFGALLYIAAGQIVASGPGVWRNALAQADNVDRP